MPLRSVPPSTTRLNGSGYDRQAGLLLVLPARVEMADDVECYRYVKHGQCFGSSVLSLPDVLSDTACLCSPRVGKESNAPKPRCDIRDWIE